MADAGIEIGAHTVSHPVLAHLPVEAREAELVTSKRLIEAKLGGKGSHSAIPTAGATWSTT